MHRLMIGVLAVALLLVPAGCLRDLSGLTMDRDGRMIAVNNRPGIFASCHPDGGKLDCKQLGFKLSTYERLDFEGVTWVDGNRFYAVIEKRDNQCLSGCELSQEVLAFSIDGDGLVTRDGCGGLVIPLKSDDNPGCAYANCGLEGVAYDSDRNKLYIAKERSKPRLYVAGLDAEHCPTGAFTEIVPPKRLKSYNDLAYSALRQSLFILSTGEKLFYSWHLPSGQIDLHSDDLPGAKKFLETHDDIEGIFVDDAKNRVLLLGESGAYLSLDLPPVSPPSKAISQNY